MPFANLCMPCGRASRVTNHNEIQFGPKKQTVRAETSFRNHGVIVEAKSLCLSCATEYRTGQDRTGLPARSAAHSPPGTEDLGTAAYFEICLPSHGLPVTCYTASSPLPLSPYCTTPVDASPSAIDVGFIADCPVGHLPLQCLPKVGFLSPLSRLYSTTISTTLPFSLFLNSQIQIQYWLLDISISTSLSLTLTLSFYLSNAQIPTPDYHSTPLPSLPTQSAPPLPCSRPGYSRPALPCLAWLQVPTSQSSNHHDSRASRSSRTRSAARVESKAKGSAPSRPLFVPSRLCSAASISPNTYLIGPAAAAASFNSTLLCTVYIHTLFTRHMQ
ncbi:hypothetical protein VTL71DRAFT_4805 [Oculimacula yallundae]|uniref:Uncharacterized protein n=1 Tax=Oculimacula yallundae TaxID=86028 RepID=A0ABR4C465_9HELO